MDTLTVTITDTETVSTIARTAKQQGTTPEQYAIQLIAAGLNSTGKSFDEILAPFRRGVKESGITDDELNGLFHRARQDYAREEEEKN